LLLIDNPEYEVRVSIVLAAIIVAVIWQVMTAVMIHFSRVNLKIIADLENRKLQLDSEIATMKDQLIFLRKELPLQINVKVREVLIEIEHKDLAPKVAQLSAESLLSTFLNDYVRPLSQDLRNSKSFQKTSARGINPITLLDTVKVFVKDIVQNNSFAPITVSMIVTATGLPTILIFVGWDKLVKALLLITFGIWILVHITSKIYEVFKKHISDTLKIFVLALLWFIPGSIVGNLLRLDTEIANNFEYLRVIGPSLTFVASMVAAVYFAGISRRTAVVQSLDKETSSRNFDLLALRQEVKISENYLIHLLHGKLQGQLNVLRTQIETGDQSTEATIREIEQSLDQIRMHELPTKDFESTLATLQNLWSRVAKINLEIPAEIKQKLKRSNNVSFATIEIIREVLNNSIKHGLAKNVDIKVTSNSPQQLQIEIINDGPYKDMAQKTGLGSQLLNDYCISWEITGDENGTVFRGAVVCPE
jgi:two-component sensor histidine kinase